MNTLETLVAKAGRRESRLDRRFVAPAMEIEIEERHFTSVNWSLGGFLIRGELPLDIGDAVTGTLRSEGSDGFTFIARLVRKEPRGRGLGFAFEELTPLALTRIGRATPPLGRRV
jgi:hypothetical protein